VSLVAVPVQSGYWRQLQNSLSLIKMKVIKIGGGCLRGKKKIAEIVDLLPEKGVGNIVVVSALYGITDILIDSMSVALEDDSKIPKIISRIKSRHLLVARHLIHSAAVLKTFGQNFHKLLAELERLYYGKTLTAS
jgi:aspartate kinase